MLSVCPLTWTTSPFITLSSRLFLAIKSYMTRMFRGGSLGLKWQPTHFITGLHFTSGHIKPYLLQCRNTYCIGDADEPHGPLSIGPVTPESLKMICMCVFIKYLGLQSTLLTANKANSKWANSLQLNMRVSQLLSIFLSDILFSGSYISSFHKELLKLSSRLLAICQLTVSSFFIANYQGSFSVCMFFSPF